MRRDRWLDVDRESGIERLVLTDWIAHASKWRMDSDMLLSQKAWRVIGLRIVHPKFLFYGGNAVHLVRGEFRLITVSPVLLGADDLRLRPEAPEFPFWPTDLWIPPRQQFFLVVEIFREMQGDDFDPKAELHLELAWARERLAVPEVAP